MKIIVDNLDNPAVIGLLEEHLADMAKHSPPESVHALDLSALKAGDVTFWTVWEESELLGCGALKELDSKHAEIKSMRTASAHTGRGVAATLLAHIIKESNMRRLSRLSLETGSMAAFKPAHSLYQKFGFTECEPFGDYVEDPFSLFMTLELETAQ
ncbi:MAG: GNAT family N-acetyltransferase [Granulosicoccaceae bacterium]